ncbi:hypothetical protein BDF20DRAFT_864501 [Mycotypha africana]|uniref:uncharacterized protein n=1 Tax=Mycotypha africana TaxID=64632 RepID=UPI002300418C|nr:uncharacterized protein BDF20DRAFT_864501 [Mycotypha africana]KAI8982006.1 hypothetical protein BDF20DRAFT_864501 [Mycotypha africana]
MSVMFRSFLLNSFRSSSSRCTLTCEFFSRTYATKLYIAWKPEEDEIIKRFIKDKGGRSWRELTQQELPLRTVRQCKNRWYKLNSENFKRGPFTPEERETLNQAVKELGENNWKAVHQQYFPQRTADKLSMEWQQVKEENKRKPWTQVEDQLILKGVEEFGTAWTAIANKYLPERSNWQIRKRYRRHLDNTSNRTKWTDDEVELLAERIEEFGKNWQKLAEGIPTRTAEQCRCIWLRMLDPASKTRQWTRAETRLFWRKVYQYGNLSKAVNQLPNRSYKQGRKQFYATLKDKGFLNAYGQQVTQELSNRKPGWITRVAKLACTWLGETQWEPAELHKLETAVLKMMEKKKKLKYEHWKQISRNFVGRTPMQCKHQYTEYINHLAPERAEPWASEEDKVLRKLVGQIGRDWDQISKMMPLRTRREIRDRWYSFSRKSLNERDK